MITKEEKKATCEKLTNLLTTTKQIVKHNKELTVAKGEHFNLFSVLDIETKENKTHSAFLTELLNPKGSHQMGDVFLKLFLEVVKPEVLDEDAEKYNDKFPTKEFITDKAYVKAEESIGKINLCNKKGENAADASGGRIDIFLRDKKGNIICIENKIHAVDQPKQIQRYCNYKTSKNTVFYLTLKDGDPIKESKLKLISGDDFYNISYREHIVQWLELCLKEVANFTYLREAINQYILLIKKLTNTMSTEYNKELFKVMMANIEESKFIADNFDKVLINLRKHFRQDVINQLESRLDKNLYKVVPGNQVNKGISQIWIELTSNPNPHFRYGIESFSGKGHKNGAMFVGILNQNNSKIIEELEDENPFNYGWRQLRMLKTKDKNNINLSHNYTVNILKDRGLKVYEDFLNTFCNQIVEFIEDYQKKLPKELFKSELV